MTIKVPDGQPEYEVLYSDLSLNGRAMRACTAYKHVRSSYSTHVRPIINRIIV